MQSTTQVSARGSVSAEFSRPYVQRKSEEEREHPRLPCKGNVEIRFLEPEARVAGSLLDLSVNGCSIESGKLQPEAENQTVEVRLSVDGARVRVAGVVRNVRRSHHAGIEFTDVSQRKAEQIKQLISGLVRRRSGLA